MADPNVYKTEPHRRLTMVIDSHEDIARNNLVGVVRPLLRRATGRDDALRITTENTGDILWVDENGRPFGAMVERKTRRDLWSSIIGHKNTDNSTATLNRYHDQMGRMLATGIPRRNIIYLLEGPLDEDPTDDGSHGRVESKTLYGAVARMTAKEGFDISMTKDIRDSALVLVNQHLAYEHAKPDSVEFKEFDYADYIHSDGKKAELASEYMWLRRLTLVPRLVGHHAKDIMRHYPTFADLMIAYAKAYVTDARSPPEMLTNVANGTGRLGPAMSKALAAQFEVDRLMPQLARIFAGAANTTGIYPDSDDEPLPPPPSPPKKKRAPPAPKKRAVAATADAPPAPKKIKTLAAASEKSRVPEKAGDFDEWLEDGYQEKEMHQAHVTIAMDDKMDDNNNDDSDDDDLLAIEKEPEVVIDERPDGRGTKYRFETILGDDDFDMEE